MDKDMKKIVKALESQSFVVFRLKSGHYGVTKDGEWVPAFGGTISDHRGAKNSIAACKRHGFRWPR
jgi:hypothetical protein